MFANKHLASLLPLRLPHWRLNRVMEMLAHRPQPLRPCRIDDIPICAYHRMLLQLMDAGNDAYIWPVGGAANPFGSNVVDAYISHGHSGGSRQVSAIAFKN